MHRISAPFVQRGHQAAACRSLEVLISLQKFSMEGKSTGKGHVSEDEKDRVRHIVEEAEDPNYWFAASRDGSRESHYRGKCSALIVSTSR